MKDKCVRLEVISLPSQGQVWSHDSAANYKEYADCRQLIHKEVIKYQEREKVEK